MTNYGLVGAIEPELGRVYRLQMVLSSKDPKHELVGFINEDYSFSSKFYQRYFQVDDQLEASFTVQERSLWRHEGQKLRLYTSELESAIMDYV